MMTLGMIAPVHKAIRKRHIRKDVRPVKKNWEEATMPHANIWKGMNRSLVRQSHATTLVTVSHVAVFAHFPGRNSQANLSTQQLHRDLNTHGRRSEDRVSHIVVIGVHPQILEEVVRICL